MLFVPRMRNGLLMQHLAGATLMLDPFPFGGGVTSMEVRVVVNACVAGVRACAARVCACVIVLCCVAPTITGGNPTGKTQLLLLLQQLPQQ